MSQGGEAVEPRGAGGSRRRVFVIPLVVFAALAALLYHGLSGDPARLPSALIGRPAPDLTLPPLEGLMSEAGPIPGFSRADLATGDVTVVNVFASWCGPCRDEHPLLMRLKATGVRMVGLNYKDNPENARRFLGGLGNPFSRVGVDPAGRAAIDWGVYGVPETFVITADGRIAHKFVGPLSEDSFKRVLMPAIEAARITPPGT